MKMAENCGWICVLMFIIFIFDGIKVVHISYRTLALDANIKIFL